MSTSTARAHRAVRRARRCCPRSTARGRSWRCPSCSRARSRRPTWWTAVLTVAWFAAYPASYAGARLLHDRRPERFRRPFAVWAACAAVPAALLLLRFPWLLWVGVVLLALVAVNARYARRNDERALAQRSRRGHGVRAARPGHVGGEHGCDDGAAARHRADPDRRPHRRLLAGAHRLDAAREVTDPRTSRSAVRARVARCRARVGGGLRGAGDAVGAAGGLVAGPALRRSGRPRLRRRACDLRGPPSSGSSSSRCSSWSCSPPGSPDTWRLGRPRRPGAADTRRRASLAA